MHTLLNAIYQYIRLTTIDRADTTDIELDISSQLTTDTTCYSIRSKIQSGDITLQSTGYIRHRTIDNSIIFQCGYGGSNSVSFLSIHTYHHNFVKCFCVFLHHKTVTFLFVYLYLQRSIANVCNRKGIANFSCNREITIYIGNRSPIHTFHHDSSTDNSISPIVYYLSLYHFLLS